MNPEKELISKLKIEISEQLPAMFRGVAEEMLEKNKEIVIKWLKDNKSLVKQVIES